MAAVAGISFHQMGWVAVFAGCFVAVVAGSQVGQTDS